MPEVKSAAASTQTEESGTPEEDSKRTEDETAEQAGIPSGKTLKPPPTGDQTPQQTQTPMHGRKRPVQGKCVKRDRTFPIIKGKGPKQTSMTAFQELRQKMDQNKTNEDQWSTPAKTQKGEKPPGLDLWTKTQDYK